SCNYSFDQPSYSVPASGGTVTATLTTGAACPWTITNNYPGITTINSDLSGSGSASLSLTIAANHTLRARYLYFSYPSGTLQITQSAGANAPTVSLASYQNPAAYGVPLFITATISPSGATGTVTLMDGSTTLGTSTLSGGRAYFEIGIGTVTPGAHSLTAVYGGDTTDSSATSSVFVQTVSQATAVVTLTSSMNPAAAGQSTTLRATIAPSVATGSVTFKDGSTTLGTATVSGGFATLVVSGLGAGTHSLTAVYGGDANVLAGTSQTLTETVYQSLTATTTAVTSSANPSTLTQSVTLT